MVLMLPINNVDQTLQDWKQKDEHEKAERLSELVGQYGPDASYTLVIDVFTKPNKWSIEVLEDQRPFMKEVANEILNDRTQRSYIHTRMILGNDLTEKMARELLELAGSIDPIHYDAFGRLYREYLSLKREQIKKTDWSYTRIMT
ncbi:MAG: hypothetical protein NTW30_02905 [Candidatus Aenigmarchaeota archaeon]|nr:hypothetical protein [Candidatus Aenigmarchaeota archaeon]